MFKPKKWARWTPAKNRQMVYHGRTCQALASDGTRCRKRAKWVGPIWAYGTEVQICVGVCREHAVPPEEKGRK